MTKASIHSRVGKADMQTVINQNSQVLMHFDLKLADGSAVDSTRMNNQPAKLHMGDGSLTASLEACLLGLQVGDSDSFRLSGEEVFGPCDPDNIQHMHTSRFNADTPLESGTIMAFSQPDGSEIPGLIREVVGDSVTIDFNHPFAGQTVIFDVEILSITNTTD